MLITIVLFLLVLSLLVFVHELGHFLTARFFGVKCEEFGMGIPPRGVGLQKHQGKWRLIWGNRENVPGESIIYSLNWIPIGGFVKIKGENGEMENETDSFGYKPVWQRNLILAAGVTMNVLLTIVLLMIGFAIGMPSSTSNLEGGIIVSKQQVQIAQVIEKSPAQAADLRVGDIVLQVDGQEINNSEQLRTIVIAKENQAVNFVIERSNDQIEKTITPIKIGENIGVGVAIADLGTVRYPIHLALWQALKATWGWFMMMILAIVALVKQLFGGPGVGVEFAGPVGIAVLTGQAAKLGWVYLLQFAALLSLNLAIINILPFPALDGGRILFLTIGKVRGKMISSKWENASHNIGFILLMVLILFITYRDLVKYGAKILSVLMRAVGL